MNNLWKAFLNSGNVDDCPVIDMHCHMDLFYGSHMPYSSPDIMAKRMNLAGVKLAVFAHHYALFNPDEGNKISIDIVKKYPDRFRAYCAINPNYPEATKKDLKTFDKFFKDIYVGFKLLPDYHRYYLSGEVYNSVFEYADSNGMIVLTHTWGGSVYDGAEEIEKVLKRYRKLKLLLGHSIHGDWKKAIEFIKRYENAYLEMCAVLDERGILEQFVEEAGSERILYGTDFPWFNHHYYIGALLGSGIPETACRNILYKNAEKILPLP
ncbi:MAG TPA: TatD family hydrolase [bacterium]|nr:TatD family hydrolase [bacterium]HPP29405.1 TatD family hydrolase [bacterium]